MKSSQSTQDRIVLSLSKKNNQTFQEVYRSMTIGRTNLQWGLDDLISQNIIHKNKETKRYSLKIETKNKVLLEIRKSKLTENNIEDRMKELREHEYPFDLGRAILRSALFTLSKLTLEKHSPKLTPAEVFEFDHVIKFYNNSIKKTFEVLEEIDFEQTLALKQGLDYAMTIPGYEKERFESLGPNEKRRKTKLAKKIIRNIPNDYGFYILKNEKSLSK
jgi:hypothetical protein